MKNLDCEILCEILETRESIEVLIKDLKNDIEDLKNIIIEIENAEIEFCDML